jgi:streptogrisin D
MKSRFTVLAVATCVTATLFAGTPSVQAAPMAKPDPLTLAAKLDKQLGARTAGSYLDKATGKLVVNVTDSSTAQSVRAAGAVARTVTRSAAQLKNVTDALDRSAKIPGTAWAVDPETNQVVVSVDKSVTGARLAKVQSVAEQFGAAARIENVAGTFSTRASGYTAGGTAIYTGDWRCSVGFNVRNSAGQHFFLTAGHCTNLGTNWYGGVQGGTGASQQAFLGTRAGTSFPGNDYGIVHYACNPGQGCDYPDVGSVFLYDCNGQSCRNQDISSAGDAFVGQSVQRSGSTTGVHGGTVTAVNSTVNYDDGTTVTGLIKTNVCAEGGDSGGSLFAGTVALGTLSGGSGNCSVGGTMWFQPVTEPLSVYGVSVY